MVKDLQVKLIFRYSWSTNPSNNAAIAKETSKGHLLGLSSCDNSLTYKYIILYVSIFFSEYKAKAVYILVQIKK